MTAMSLAKTAELKGNIDKIVINMFNMMGINLLAQVVSINNFTSFCVFGNVCSSGHNSSRFMSDVPISDGSF